MERRGGWEVAAKGRRILWGWERESLIWLKGFPAVYKTILDPAKWMFAFRRVCLFLRLHYLALFWDGGQVLSHLSLVEGLGVKYRAHDRTDWMNCLLGRSRDCPTQISPSPKTLGSELKHSRIRIEVILHFRYLFVPIQAAPKQEEWPGILLPNFPVFQHHPSILCHCISLRTHTLFYIIGPTLECQELSCQSPWLPTCLGKYTNTSKRFWKSYFTSPYLAPALFNSDQSTSLTLKIGWENSSMQRGLQHCPLPAHHWCWQMSLLSLRSRMGCGGSPLQSLSDLFSERRNTVIREFV